MRQTTIYIDENLVRLAKKQGINISREFQTYLAKRVEAYQDPNSKESLVSELNKLQAKSDAIKNQIQILEKENKMKSKEQEVTEPW